MTTTAAAPAASWPTSTLERLLRLDFTLPRPFAILSAAFILLRLPYVNYGHGTDPDAWRVALTAHHLLEAGQYFPSRLPGNPLHELLMTPLSPGGWLAMNIATTLAALLGVYIFARIVAWHRLPYSGLLTIGFAFTPLLYINSLTTMDYMWTLTAILGSYYCVLRGWPLWAGICLGIAIGCRLQSLIMWLPLAYLIFASSGPPVRTGPSEGAMESRPYPTSRRWRDIIAFTLAAGGVATLAFSPVLAVYGHRFFNFYDAPVAYTVVLRLLGKEALGVIGGLGVLAGVALSARRLLSLPSDAFREPVIAVWCGVIVLYFASFFRLPHEIAYLIPVFPFGFLLMGRYFTRPALMAAIGAVLLAGVVDITTPGDGFDPATLRAAEIGRGLIFSNADTMTIQHDFVDDILESPVPDHSVVMAGFVYPQLAIRERGRLDIRVIQRDYEAISMLSDRGEAVDEARDVRYVWLLTYDTFTALRSQGYSYSLVPDAAGGTAALFKYRPSLFGATFLRLDRSAPSAGKGTASTDR